MWQLEATVQKPKGTVGGPRPGGAQRACSPGGDQSIAKSKVQLEDWPLMSPLVAGILEPLVSKPGSMAALMHTGHLEMSYVVVSSPFWNLLPQG